MGDARYTKDGLLIPNKWLKPLGRKVRIQRSGDALIIESEQREAARKELGRLARSLRATAKKLRAPTIAEIERIVKEVRKARAGSR